MKRRSVNILPSQITEYLRRLDFEFTFNDQEQVWSVTIPKARITDLEREIDLTPKGIIDRFDLFSFNKYSENCVYGHFGNKDVPWEKIGW